MQQSEVFDKVKSIIAVYCKNEENLKNATNDTRFLEDLDINSARLVDIVLDIEDGFDIEIEDESMDKISTIGNAVELIMAKSNA